MVQAKEKERNEEKIEVKIETRKEVVRRHFAEFSQTQDSEERTKVFEALGGKKLEAFKEVRAEIAQEVSKEAEQGQLQEVPKERKGRRIRELLLKIERNAATETQDQQIKE